jgi:4-amino-4-deoxy-L-arabinose transferase-like glycosyltransferase
LVEWPTFLYPMITSDSTIDSAFFAYAGELLRTGGKPYITHWDHKPPLIYLINAAGLALSALSDGRIWGVWITTWVALGGALALGYFAMRRAFGALAAVLGTVFFGGMLPTSTSSPDAGRRAGSSTLFPCLRPCTPIPP